MKIANAISILFSKKELDVDRNHHFHKSIPEDRVIVTIPEPVINESTIPNIDESKHNSFNVILLEKGTKCRVMSEKSKEFLRIVCIGHDNKFEYVCNILNRELSEVERSCVGNNMYNKSEYVYHFIMRCFRTDSGHYFVQYIRADNSTAYVIKDVSEMQYILETCESGSSKDDEKNKSKFKKTNCDNYWLVEPGRYTMKNYRVSDTSRQKVEEYVDSYEIIDKEIYDGVIAPL